MGIKICPDMQEKIKNIDIRCSAVIPDQEPIAFSVYSGQANTYLGQVTPDQSMDICGTEVTFNDLIKSMKKWEKYIEQAKL